MILLSRQERERFATYLEQEAQGDDGLSQQLGGTPAVQRHYRTNAAHKMFVAQFLRSIEDM